MRATATATTLLLLRSVILKAVLPVTVIPIISTIAMLILIVASILCIPIVLPIRLHDTRRHPLRAATAAAITTATATGTASSIAITIASVMFLNIMIIIIISTIMIVIVITIVIVIITIVVIVAVCILKHMNGSGATGTRNYPRSAGNFDNRESGSDLS